MVWNDDPNEAPVSDEEFRATVERVAARWRMALDQMED